MADLEGAEPAPPPFGRRTDAVTHGTWYVTMVLYYSDSTASLSVQTRKHCTHDIQLLSLPPVAL